jgi:hypothetical protein
MIIDKKLCDPDDNSYLDRLMPIAVKDAEGLVAAHRWYANSWKKRFGVGAAMMLLRKIDRLEKFLSEHNYDIFAAMDADTRGEGIIDDIRDLRRYLLLVEAEAQARSIECACATHRDNLEETGRVVTDLGPLPMRHTNVDGESVVRNGPKDDRGIDYGRIIVDRDPGPSGSVSYPHEVKNGFSSQPDGMGVQDT